MATSSSLRRWLLLVGVVLLVIMGAARGAHDEGANSDEEIENDQTFDTDDPNNLNPSFPTRIVINYGISMLSLGFLVKISWLILNKKSK